MRQRVCAIVLCMVWLTFAVADARKVQPEANKKNKKKTPGITICGTMPPPGFVTVSVDGICGKQGSTQLIGRTIVDISTMPTGATIDTCGDAVPSNWTSMRVYDAPCAQIGNAFYMRRTIMRIDGMDPGTTIKTCGATIPSGWSSTKVESQPCARFINSFFIARNLTKHEGLPANTQIKVCGNSSIPDGWVTTKVAAGHCGSFMGAHYIGRTLLNVAGMPPGSTVSICSGNPPFGWVAESVSAKYCGSHGSDHYIERRIKRIAGLPYNTKVRICGGDPPHNWLVTKIAEKSCAVLGNAMFIDQTIVNVEGAPIGTVVALCGGSIPAGWKLKSNNGYCAHFGNKWYLSRTIVKASASGNALLRTSADAAANPFFAGDGATVISADFDGDGIPDHAIAREESGSLTFSIVSSADDSVRIERLGHAGDIPLAADWDNDGRADITVFRRGTEERPESEFLYRLADSEIPRSITLTSCTALDVPILGDYDGDGRLDAAVHRKVTGTWVVRRSSDGEERSTSFGWTDGVPVVADYDADRITDFALFRGGEWWILASTEGERRESFGDGGDRPLATDDDGDGRADLAVSREGAWRIRHTSDGQVREVQP